VSKNQRSACDDRYDVWAQHSEKSGTSAIGNRAVIAHYERRDESGSTGQRCADRRRIRVPKSRRSVPFLHPPLLVPSYSLSPLLSLLSFPPVPPISFLPLCTSVFFRRMPPVFPSTNRQDLCLGLCQNLFELLHGVSFAPSP